LNERQEQVKKIYRSRKQRVIAGVCGGVAEYFNIDPVWVRIVWVLSILFKGLGIIAYALCWILIPEREEIAGAVSDDERAGASAGGSGSAAQAAEPVEPASEGSNPRFVMGVVLIVLGCIFGVMAFIPFLNDRAFWALALIVLGVVLIAKR